MSSNQALDKGSDTLTAVVFVAILLSVSILAVAIIVNALTTASEDLNGQIYNTVTVTNETGAYINATGYTVAGALLADTDQYTVTAAYNATDDTLIGSGNYTISVAGVVTNSTTTNYDDVLISYTYRLDVTDTEDVAAGLTGIRDNVISMVANFFALMPTIGTILAVVILIAVIVLLVMYVSRMRRQETPGSFTG